MFEGWKSGEFEERDTSDDILMSAFYASNNPRVAVIAGSLGRSLSSAANATVRPSMSLELREARHDRREDAVDVEQDRGALRRLDERGEQRAERAVGRHQAS